MARIKGGMPNAKKKHKQSAEDGKRLQRRTFQTGTVSRKQSVMRALTSSYAGRQRKRQFRQLWIARINASSKNGMVCLLEVYCMV